MFTLSNKSIAAITLRRPNQNYLWPVSNVFCLLVLITVKSRGVWLIQIVGGKVYLRLKGKTLLGVVNNFFVLKSLLTTPSNVLPLHLSHP